MSDAAWMIDIASSAVLWTLVVVGIVALSRKLPVTITEPITGPVAWFAASMAAALTASRVVSLVVFLRDRDAAHAASSVVPLPGAYLYLIYWNALSLVCGALPLLFLIRSVRNHRGWLLRIPAVALLPWVIQEYARWITAN
jgi:hypothetical protein